MKKTDKKTTVLRIFEKSDGEKAYMLERDGFYELREGKEDSLWKNLDVTLEEGDPLSLKRKLSLSVKLFKKAAPLGPVPEAKEFYFTRCDSKKVPSSFTMDEAIREWEEKGGKRKAEKERERESLAREVKEAISGAPVLGVDEEGFFVEGKEGIVRLPYDTKVETGMGDRKVVAISPSGEKIFESTPVTSEEIGKLWKDTPVLVPEGVESVKSVSGESLGKTLTIEKGEATFDSLYSIDSFYSVKFDPISVKESLSPRTEEVPPPIYAESFLPHFVRTKEEGVLRDIEMDTMIIDRGVAVSQGLLCEEPGKERHADMVMGLKVRYAEENSLPGDSAFILYKEDWDEEEEEEDYEKMSNEALARKLMDIQEDIVKFKKKMKEIESEWKKRHSDRDKVVPESEAKSETLDKTFLLLPGKATLMKTVTCEGIATFEAYSPSGAEELYHPIEVRKEYVESFETSKDSEGTIYATLRLRDTEETVFGEKMVVSTYRIIDKETIDGLQSFLGKEGVKSKSEALRLEREHAIKRGGVYIPRSKIINEADVPKELIAAGDRIELKFKDVSRIDKVFRERTSGDGREDTILPEEWLIYVKVYHEDDLDECILRVVRGEADEMINLICEQRGLICKVIMLHDNASGREELKLVKTFSPTTGKIAMDFEIVDLLPW